ncbi:hypothetical protein [Krasilnikovia sp. MM14-A1259]|uniref:hypothetical protein n=1 Tax=Krasilnikovia sp. MM14-A1259 TaxID=3373539 RepID=UPI0038016AF3
MTGRFKVRPDAFFVRRPDGVRLSNNAGSFTIRGAGAYRLVAAVFGNLDGERTVDELVSGLPDAARRSVRELVATLARNGFVTEVRHPAEPVPDWLRQLYPAQLDFLGLHADRPVARFHQARSAPLLVAGGGVALTALLAALTDFGLARVHVVTTKADDSRVAEVLSAAMRRDGHLRYPVEYADELDPTELAERAGRLDAAMVLLADETGSAHPAEVPVIGAAQARLRESGRNLGVLGRCGDFTVALPGGPDGCWSCLHRWMAARAVAATGKPLPPAAAPATIAALHLAQHAFTTLAGAPQDGFDRITTVEPLAPVVRTHLPRRHPRCPVHSASAGPVHSGPDVRRAGAVRSTLDPGPGRADDLVRPDVPAAEDEAELVAVADRIVTATAGWTDHVLGPILALGEEDVDQIPLAASVCRVAEPDNTAAEPSTTAVVCRAISPREARNQVVLVALEHLARGIAAAAGALPDGWQVGAGWSHAEAVYRARLAASAAAPTAPGPLPGPDATEPATDAAAGARDPAAEEAEPAVLAPAGAFLAGELAARGLTWRQTGADVIATGFVRVVLETPAGAVTGHGVHAGHARDNALLRTVVGGAPGVPAHVAPPAGTWQQALARLDERARWAPGRDLSHLLGFLGDAAYVIAVPGVPA